MRKNYRVKKDVDFRQIFDHKKNVANRCFIVYRLEREQDHFRVGLSVSKKLGNAVTRNRIKRRLRHVIMELSPQLVSDDFVVIARKGVEDLTYEEIKINMIHVLSLARLYKEGRESEK